MATDANDRLAEAIVLLESKPDASGRWPLENPHPGRQHFPVDEGEGKPSRWNTLGPCACSGGMPAVSSAEPDPSWDLRATG